MLYIKKQNFFINVFDVNALYVSAKKKSFYNFIFSLVIYL